MSNYPGNPSLSPVVKDRVGSTFQQTLTLFKQGRVDEVVAGCNLILQMDPMYDPARKLMEKARNPSAPIDVDQLLPSDGGDDSIRQAREAMAARDFQRVIHITTEILTNDLMNDDARVLGDEAREKMEAAPFVDQFVKKCEENLAGGNNAAARQVLEKARALDPTHPGVQRMEQMVGVRSSAPAPAPSAPVAFDPGTSFVVEAPGGAPARGSAQASDFGFTFEEEKAPEPAAGGGFAAFSFGTPAADSFGGGGAGGFSFDAPSSSPPTPAGGFSFDSPSPASAPAAGSFSFDSPSPSKSGTEFDFSSAAVATTADDQAKIEQYLADGDRAYEGGDYQHAIDLWSRIFLIDVTNDAASERIEAAKGKRREVEQKVDGLLSAGVQAFEKRDSATARAKFGEVLQLDPSNHTALDYMERLTETVTEGGAAGYEVPYEPPPSTLDDDLFGDDEISMGSIAPPLAPPEPAAPAAAAAGSKKAAAAPAKTKATAAKKSPVGLIAVIAAVAILGVGGWFAWTKFMNKPEVDSAAGQQIVAQAQALARQGKYDQAIALLRDVKAEDPQHDEALELIADLQQKKSQAAEMIDGKPANQFYAEQIVAGQAAVAAHDYDAAKKAFEQAVRVRPLTPEAKAFYDTAAQQVAKLDGAKALFGERKFQDAINVLQPMSDADPQNRNIQRMILDAHFNLGAAALQEEKLPDAVREFDEVLKVDPNDELARRSRELALRYEGQPKDLLYKIYVKYLPLRQVL